MTKEKFVSCLLSSGFRECTSGDGYTLYERDGNYIFAYDGHIASSLSSPDWSAQYDEIKLTRSRHGWFEIERIDGSSITLVSEDDFEIGCMG